MLKKMNKKGFTLAELLIVVAIIGVLVAISIPIFTAQLQKARLATNQANARAAYAATVAALLDENVSVGTKKYDVKAGVIDSTAATCDTTVAGAINGWTTSTGDLGTKVADVWEVTIAADGATFKAHFPSSS